MPWTAIELKPGVNVELTPTALKTGYISTTLGRFKSGLFQKIGGWVKFTSQLVSGVPKVLHAWQTLSGSKLLAVGATNELGVLTSSTHQVITPATFLSDTAANFSTSAGSNLVTVVDANINTVTTYDSVFFNTPITVDAIILSGLYAINSYVSSTSYTILAGSNGASGVSNQGAVPAFTTTSGSYTVKVTLANHNLVTNSDVVFPISTTVGGATISGHYVVTSIVDANNFNITTAVAASSGAGPTNMNGGNAELLYYIATGPTQAGGNYGAGLYGSGGYGTGSPLVGQTGTPITATDWTIGNWGEDLIACPENGGVYYWAPSSGFSNATLIPTGPVYNTGAFISTAQQMIIAYGSTATSSIGVYQDPLLVKWCDVQNFFQWAPAITNQAGSFRIPTGSKIIAGSSTPYMNLIWTDVECWAMNYIGSSLVFGFVKAGSNCGLIAKHAFTQQAGNVFWMGTNNFFIMSGGNVSIIPCTVWDTVFQDLDTANASKCFAGSNTLFSEVIFGYPSIQDGTGYPTRYVKLNISEGTWDIGLLQRNCWIDQSVLGNPMAATNSGLIYTHESGYDNDTSPITTGFTTGYFMIAEGEDLAFVDRIIPDFKYGTTSGAKNAIIQISVNAINSINDTPKVYGPYTTTATASEITTRLRARQVSFTVQSSDSGSFWRLGRIRMRYAPDGKR